MRTLLTTFTALIAVTSTGCAGAWQTSVTWLDIASVSDRPTQADYPNADAVYLALETELHQTVDYTQGKPYKTQAVHAALVVLNESGQRYSNVRIPVNEDTEVLRIEARSIAPDGTITPLQPDKIYDDESDKDGDSDVRVFAMPKVQVGSIIEYVHVTREQALGTSFEYFLQTSAPIQRRTVRFSVDTKRARWRAKAYHTDIAFQVTKGSPFTTISWEGRDLPKRDGEPFDPPTRSVVPHLKLVFTKLVLYSGRVVVDFYQSWDSALKRRFKKMVVERKFAKGYKLSPTLAKLSAAPVSERLRAAYDLARTIPYSGLESYAPRTFTRVLKERTADDHEKVLLTHHILRELGVKAWLAMTRKRSSGPVDTSFPTYAALNRMVVRVPAQPGLDTPLWLQPWCTHCSLGEVTHLLHGAAAYVLKGTPGSGDDHDPEGVWETIDGALEPTDSYQRATTLTLAADGSATARTRWDYSGDWGTNRREWHGLKTNKEIEKKVTKWIQNDYPNAEVSDVELGLVEKPGAPMSMSCSWSDTLVAKLAKDKLLLQLDKGGVGWTDDPFERHEARSRDIVFWRPNVDKLIHTVTPPDGYVFQSTPPNVERTEPFASYRSTWRLDKGNLVHVLVLERQAGRWDKSEIDTFRDFFEAYRRTMDPILTMVPKTR